VMSDTSEAFATSFIDTMTEKPPQKICDL
jgi:hypothetical protein